jgi:hypothetical protein
MPITRYDDSSHAYYDRFGRVASVTQVLSASGIGGYDKFRMMQVTAPEKLAAAGERGRKVHEATQYYDDGLLDFDTLDPALVPYLTAYRRWLAETGFEPLGIEHMIYSERFRYAGRLDRIGVIGGRKWVVDLKSGMLIDGYAVQLAAYVAALPQPLTYDRMIVQLCDDGRFVIQTPEKSTYYTHLNAFLTALDCHRDVIEERYA